MRNCVATNNHTFPQPNWILRSEACFEQGVPYSLFLSAMIADRARSTRYPVISIEAYSSKGNIGQLNVHNYNGIHRG